MRSFEVLISETLQKRIKVMATGEKDAKNKISEMYHDGKIVLGADDFWDYSIEVL